MTDDIGHNNELAQVAAEFEKVARELRKYAFESNRFLWTLIHSAQGHRIVISRENMKRQPKEIKITKTVDPITGDITLEAK